MVQPPIQGYMAVTQWSIPYTRLYGSNTVVQPPIQGYMTVKQWSNTLYKAMWQ